ncbi:helix-turn-helix domain-containing protein [Nocardia amamiensis]|uniref:helix-turn-helix domain-containing protein n=1 Tax=Nocardia amamiensis TaxID=404578 RepID=UPI0012F47DA5|nr:helix-turn-helix transcriptional regulator [Nocardia amamiensis]
MNVDRDQSGQIGSAVWEHREMRQALASRDLKRVYELLQRVGISQRGIARLTGQSASEVYEVLYKSRRIMAYDVLVRIADGLGIPRGYMGLAYDETTETALDLAAANCSINAAERDEVRDLLCHAANVTMGTTVSEVARWWQPLDRETAPAPSRIGPSDVQHLQAITAAMRAVDYRHGGGACRDAVAAQVRWAQQLLDADCAAATRRQLVAALADLHNLAGWTSFDVGMYSISRRHFTRALELARDADDHSLAANVLYRMGRLHLHRVMPLEALRFFQLGQITAQDSGCTLTVAMLCANEGVAYAHLDDREQMLRSLGRAQDEFARSEPETARAWVRFFGQADLDASRGVALTALRSATRAELDDAVRLIGRAISMRGPDMTRSRIFELIAFATAHLRNGSTERGVRAAYDAVSSTSTVRSVRTVDRLAPLHEVASNQQHHSELKHLVHSIDSLRALT